MSRLDRQRFLGPDSDPVLDCATIGFVGHGGGGSHAVQQAAHMGMGGYVNADPDVIAYSNTNRLIGGTLADVAVNRPKVAIAERLIRGLQPEARIVSVQDHWRAAADDLKLCDIIVGAVDSFKEREQLERFGRRHLIP
jgi:tRNA A37 threonylcarbamoyladenosine dehydratase